MTMRLNVGCGGVRREGWVNVDNDPDLDVSWGPVDVRGPLPFPDETFDYAVAHHVLDQLVAPDVDLALASLYAVLRPGGVLRISTPNILAGCAAMQRRERDWFPPPFDDGPIDQQFDAWLSCGGLRRSFFTGPRWMQALWRAGFDDTRLVVSGVTDLCDDPAICELDGGPERARESLFLEARR